MATINTIKVTDEEFLNLKPSELTESSTYLKVNDQEYKAVNSVLELIKILYDYIKIIRFIKEISYEASELLLELLNKFNSTTYSLILGSGAFINDTLPEGITVKHLCFTTQTILFILAELPHLKNQMITQCSRKTDKLILKITAC